MKLFVIHTTERNGEQEYSNVHLAAAENIDRAWEIAREFALTWYDDTEEPEEHKTDDENVFEYDSGCLSLSIDSVGETTIADWIRSRICHCSITTIPDELLKVELGK